MATMLEVWRKYRPQIKHGPIMEGIEIMENLVHGTGLTQGQVYSVVYELETVKVRAGIAGRSLRLPTGDLYRPVMRRDGTIDINLVPNKDWIRQINLRFHGKVLYACNIGKTEQQMADFWNERHPDNPVQL